MRRAGLALFIVAAAQAQSQTGRVEGYVLGADGMPIAGAEVVATSPTQIGGAKKTWSDANGEFRFVALTPGKFNVRASKAGLITDERAGIWVGVNATITLTFMLVKAETKEEVYVVKAERPVVDTKRTSTGERVPHEFSERIPVFFRRPQAVTQYAPGVTGTGNPNMRGGGFFNNSYTVDGVETTDPVTHTFGTNFNFDAIQDVDVQTAGMGAENGMVTGGVANLVTKSGSNDFHIDTSVYHQDDNLALKDPAEEGATFREENANVNVSGPILRDRLWYFVSAQYDDRVTSIPCDPDELGAGLCPHPAQKRNGVLHLAKITWQAHPKHKLTFWQQGEYAEIDNTQQLPTVAADAEGHQDQHSEIFSVSHDFLITQKLFLRSQFSYQFQRLEIFPQSGDFSTPGYEADSVTGIASGNYTGIRDDQRNRVSVQQTFTYFYDRRAFSMEPHLGYKLWYGWNPTSERVPGDMTLRQADGENGSQTIYCETFNQELDRDDPNRCVEGALVTKTKGLFASVFLDDALKPTKHITVTPGVGLHIGKTTNYAGDTITNFQAVTPHLNATWDPFRSGKTVLKGGYNQYVDVGFLAIPGFVGKQIFQERCDWDPAARAYVANCARYGGEGSVTVGQPNAADPTETVDLDPPRTHEFLAAVEREIARGTSLGGEFVFRKYNHLFEDVETNLIWNERGNDIVGSRDPERPAQTVFDLETPDEARRRYISFSFTGKRFVGNWNFLASYTWARSEGTVNEYFATVYLDNPTQAKYYDGFLPDDRRHTLKGFVAAQVTRSFNAGASFQYSTGSPFSKYYYNDYYGDFLDLRARRGYDPNDVNDPSDDTEARLPDVVEIGVKLDYNLSRLTGQNIDVIAEAFNLLNTRTADATQCSVSPATCSVEQRNLGPDAPVQYGDVVNPQDPLRVRLGLRYRY